MTDVLAEAIGGLTDAIERLAAAIERKDQGPRFRPRPKSDTPQREDLVNWLEQHPDSTPKEVAEGLGWPRGNVRRLLFAMLRSGQVQADREHRYRST